MRGPVGWVLLLCVAFLFRVGETAVPGCDANCVSPRRPKSEQEFVRIGHTEASKSTGEMEEKLKVIKARRKQPDWNRLNPEVQEALQRLRNASARHGRLPNILMILADDLGYGDLSVPPFVQHPAKVGPHASIKGLMHPKDKNRTDINWHTWPCEDAGGALTPNLERMAANGVVMSNFHSGSPVCSPSRAATMTGLFPWRVGALNAFELGRDMSQRNGFLPQIPTGPEILRQYGYFTGHSGKWHLGGMREEQRVQRAYRDDCQWPSPNQHGFETYISELDGPESPRYTFLLKNLNLHSQGYRWLLNNDVPMPVNPSPQVLSDREAADAAAMIRNITAADPDQPWYIQTWFNAPHGPWEVLPAGEQVYSRHYEVPENTWKLFKCGNHDLYEARDWAYKTMVTAMDASIGMLLDTVEELGIAEDTLIVFHSDNGPEVGAGNPGPFKEKKRSLLEGGIRVPAIWQWKGHLQAGSTTDAWGANVDMFPTFLEAAGLTPPAHVKWDGLSLLAALERSKVLAPGSSGTSTATKEENIAETPKAPSAANVTHPHRHHRHHPDHPWGFAYDGHSYSQRLFLWHKDTESVDGQQDRMQGAAVFDQVKVTTTGASGCMDRVFDLKHDPFEDHNFVTQRCKVSKDTPAAKLTASVKESISSAPFVAHCKAGAGGGGAKEKVDACVKRLYDALLAKVELMLPPLFTFVREGDHPMADYRQHRKEATCLVPTADMIRATQFSASCKPVE